MYNIYMKSEKSNRIVNFSRNNMSWKLTKSLRQLFEIVIKLVTISMILTPLECLDQLIE